MSSYRQISNSAPIPHSFFCIGNDSSTLFFRTLGGFFVLVGRGCYLGMEGQIIPPKEVNRGKGVRALPCGTVLEIIT